MKFVSLLFPGLRQLRVGHRRRGFAVHGASLLLLLAAAATSWLHTPFGLLTFLGLVVAGEIWSVRDARGVSATHPVRPLLWAWLALPITLIALVVTVPVLRRDCLGIQMFRIPGQNHSSAPTLRAGDRFLADMRYYDAREPRHGDIVLFDAPDRSGRTWVKRVVGVAGEEHGGAVVPPAHVFVQGDNAEASRDSRHFGPVPIWTITGRPLYVVWGRPWNRIGERVR